MFSPFQQDRGIGIVIVLPKSINKDPRELSPRGEAGRPVELKSKRQDGTRRNAASYAVVFAIRLKVRWMLARAAICATFFAN